MKLSVCLLLLFTLLLCLNAGCSTTDKGSREFIPGKGWVPVK